MKRKSGKRLNSEMLKTDERLLKLESEALKETTHRKWFVLFIGIFSLLLYINTFEAGFAIDDHLMITRNNFTVKGVAGIPDIISNDLSVGYFGRQINMAGIHYRPIPQIIFALQYEFFGNDPMAGHVVNSVCYALLCMLLFVTLFRLLSTHLQNRTLPIALATTLLFAAHPIHTEVVANIKSLDEILALIGALGALLYSLKYYSAREMKYLIVSGLFFLLGAFSKENTLTFLFVIPISLYLFRNPTRAVLLKTISPLVVVTLLLFIIRGILLSNGQQEAYISEFLINPFINASPVEHLATLVYIWGKYLWQFIWPFTLTTDYFPFAIPLMSWASWQVWASLVVIGTLTFAIIKYRKRYKLMWYGFLFFVITFSMTSNLFFFSGSPMSERFMFMPSIGLCLVLVGVGYQLLDRLMENGKKVKWTALTMLVLIIGLFSWRTVDRNMDWRTEDALLLQDVETSSGSSRANVNAAHILIKQAGNTTGGEQRSVLLDKAENHIEAALQILPDNYQAYQQWTRLHRMRGDEQSATISENKNEEIRARLRQKYRRKR